MAAGAALLAIAVGGGESVLVTVDPRPSSIWVIDAATGQATPLTTDMVHSYSAVWSPDGTRVAFNHAGSPSPIAWMVAQAGAKLHHVFAPDSGQRVGDIGVIQWTRAAGFLGYETGARGRYARGTSCGSAWATAR